MCPLCGHIFYYRAVFGCIAIVPLVVGLQLPLCRGKAFPLGGRWRGTRRMRGKCPAAANFSLISRLRRQLPPKGEAKDAVCPLCRNVRMAARAAYMPPLQATRYFRVDVMSRAGHAPPLPRNDFYCPVGRGDPTPPCGLAVISHCRCGGNGRHICRPYKPNHNVRVAI